MLPFDGSTIVSATLSAFCKCYTQVATHCKRKLSMIRFNFDCGSFVCNTLRNDVYTSLSRCPNDMHHLSMIHFHFAWRTAIGFACSGSCGSLCNLPASPLLMKISSYPSLFSLLITLFHSIRSVIHLLLQSVHSTRNLCQIPSIPATCWIWGHFSTFEVLVFIWENGCHIVLCRNPTLLANYWCNFWGIINAFLWMTKSVWHLSLCDPRFIRLMQDVTTGILDGRYDHPYCFLV